MFRVLATAVLLAAPLPLAAEEMQFNVIQETATFQKSDIVSARAELAHGSWAVRIVLTPSAAARFGELTGRGVRKRMQIVVGDRIVSTATIMERIAGGEIMLQSHFSETEARELAARLE